MQQLIINADMFGGIFPRKGQPSVRVEDQFSGTHWVPVQGRTVVVARQRHCSEGYIPAECLPQEFVATLKEWQIWLGQTGGRYVWKHDLPEAGVRLVADWKSYVCNGADGISRFTVPAGTVIIAGQSGCPAQAGYHWEVAA